MLSAASAMASYTPLTVPVKALPRAPSPAKALVQMEDGSVVPRTAGTPQGGVISPLLANLFLHYAFDAWMSRNYPHIPFERYADDVICHCKSAEEARALWSALQDRFAACKLVLHPEKTKIVYCKDANRRPKAAWPP